MKSNSYWKKRFEQLEESSNKKAKNTIKELEPIFESAEKEIESKISVWYQRFATNNNITIQEAKKWLNDKQLDELKWSVEEYIKYGEENAINQKWLKELENASAKFHINRLEALKLQTRQTIEALYRKEEDTIKGLLKGVYEDGYYNTIYEIQKGLNIGYDVAKVDSNVLEKIISKPWSTDGRNFSDRIWSSKEQLINSLHSELTKACLLGKNPREVVKKIKDSFGVSEKQAARLVYTEQAYFNSLSQLDGYKNLGVNKFEVIGTLDGKTCSTCGDMDGMIFDLKDYEPGVTANPFHPRCRCTTAPAIDEEFDIAERAARDENGKTYYVPSNMKYNEWKEKYVKENITDSASKVIVGAKATKELTTNEEYAISTYIGSESYIINESLRNNTALDERLTEVVKNLDIALDKMPNYEGIVTRSVSISSEDIDYFLKKYPEGKIMSHNEFLSTTVGEIYNPEARVQMEIISKTGKDIRKYNKAEQEILFKRDVRFFVRKIDTADDYFVKIYLEEV